MTYPPIGDYALLSNCHSAALVSRDGSVDWCCFHRMDARPVFARLLDWERGGHFRIGPAAYAACRRRYVPDTNVVETRFTGDNGDVVVTDCLPVLTDDDLSDVHRLVRLVRAEGGPARVDVEFRPRFDYGLTVPRLELSSPHVGVVYGGADGLVIESTWPMEQTELCGCHTEVDLDDGEEGMVVITYELPHRLEAQEIGIDKARALVSETIEFWTAWAGRCSYDGPYRDAVVRSALVLKALTNHPTGAIVAAPTTSLPEVIGGGRNWDYRYSWLRDAALDLYALFRLGYTDEAHAFMGWIKRTTAGRAEGLQPLYGVGGERLIPEVELADLDGYRGSRPVRIGNAAADQVQLDVYGELLDTAWLYHRHGGEIDPPFAELLTALVDVVVDTWSEPDEGIWEVRDAARHFVSSKVMAWVAVDRGLRLRRRGLLEGDEKRWTAARDHIRAAVLRDGVDHNGAFVRACGEGGIDASNLLIPLVRFLPPDDPRVGATIDRISSELTVDGFVRRYFDDDGLGGDEGAFLICSFWLVENLTMRGDVERARELFERLLTVANDVGLLAEQCDPSTGEALGNFPQAFSHVGLISAALNLKEAT